MSRRRLVCCSTLLSWRRWISLSGLSGLSRHGKLFNYCPVDMGCCANDLNFLKWIVWNFSEYRWITTQMIPLNHKIRKSFKKNSSPAGCAKYDLNLLLYFQLTTTISHLRSCSAIWQRQRQWKGAIKADSIRIMETTTAVIPKQHSQRARLRTFRWESKEKLPYRSRLPSHFNDFPWLASRRPADFNFPGFFSIPLVR